MFNWILDLEVRHQSRLAREQLRREDEDRLREREVKALETIAAAIGAPLTSRNGVEP